MVRFFKYMLRKLLRFLRFTASLASNDQQEINENNDAWYTAKNKLNDAEHFVMEKRTTNWPLVMFFGVVFGGPWVIWKILSSIDSNNKDDSLWMTGKVDHFIAVSEYDFDAVNVDELSFRRGQRIIIAPKGSQQSIFIKK